MIERKGHKRRRSSIYVEDTVICDLSSVATSAVFIRHNYTCPLERPHHCKQLLQVHVFIIAVSNTVFIARENTQYCTRRTVIQEQPVYLHGEGTLPPTNQATHRDPPPPSRDAKSSTGQLSRPLASDKSSLLITMRRSQYGDRSNLRSRPGHPRN